MPSSHIGRVKFYDSSKRFGFVEDFDGDEDAYLGEDGLLSPPLQSGELIMFELAPSRRGKSPSAHSVQRLTKDDERTMAERYDQITPSPERRVGRVKFFDQTKGFGFVRDILDGSEVYVGERECAAPLHDRDLVAFERQTSNRGRRDQAARVRLLQDEPGRSALALRYVPTDVKIWSRECSVSTEDLLRQYLDSVSEGREVDRPRYELRLRVELASGDLLNAELLAALKTDLLPFLGSEGWAALTQRVLDEWLSEPNAILTIQAALAFDRQRNAAGDGVDSNFRRAIAASAGDGTPVSEFVRGKLWEEGWPEAFSLQIAALAFASNDPVGTLRQTPDERFGELVDHLVAAHASPEGISSVLDAVLDAATPRGRAAKTPSALRALRADLDDRDRERYERALEAALRAGADGTRLALFLDGYHDDFDLEGALRSGAPLLRPVVEGLLALPGLSRDGALQVLLSFQSDKPPTETPDDARRWLEEGEVDRNAVLDAVAVRVETLPEVETAAVFLALREHLRLLVSHGRAEPPLTGRSADLVRVDRWLQHDDPEGFDPEADRHLVVYLPPADQIQLLRKLAALHKRGDLTLTADHLKGFVVYDADLDRLAQAHGDVRLDLSAEIFIQVIVGLLGSTRRLPEGGLLRIAYRGLAKGPDRKLSLADLGVLERCPGRTVAEFAAPYTPGGMVRLEGDDLVLAFEGHEAVLAEVQKIPGSTHDADGGLLRVPAEHVEAVRAFAEPAGFEFHLSGGFKTDNKHFFHFERTGDVPRGITYCEGREALQPDRFHGRPFWWCANAKCFQNAETPHEPHEWENYTLLDVARALGCETDEQDGQGRTIANGRYYAFVGAVNRVDRLLRHLECRSCENPLYPERTAHFALYRVTQFCCRERQCERYEKTVYLHHCLRGACGSIIDSRDTRKCPNGWYVCANQSCGACCSDRTFARRAANLAAVGAGGGSRGTERGHLEAGEAFCSRCGRGDLGTRMGVTEIDDRGDRAFSCPSCGRTVDRRWRS